jgi:hypothetical protein
MVLFLFDWNIIGSLCDHFTVKFDCPFIVNFDYIEQNRLKALNHNPQPNLLLDEEVDGFFIL